MEKNVKKWIYGGLFIVALFVILFVTGVLPQSVITPPVQATLQNGQVLWYATVSGDSIKDGVGFVFAPSTYIITSNDASQSSLIAGTKVVPGDSVIVYFSNGGNYCSYVMQSQQKNYKLGLAPLNYFVLQNPFRHIIVNTCVNGVCKDVDSANIGGDVLTFSANGGLLTVKGIGVLMGVQGCPEYSNVAIVLDSSNIPHYVTLSDLASRYDGLSLLNAPLLYSYSSSDLATWFSKYSQSAIFVSQFSGTPVINSPHDLLTANMPSLTLGAGVVTLTGDAKYFNSAFIVPSQQASPIIDSVIINDLKQGSTGSAKITFHNKVTTGGVVNIKASAQKSQVNPATQSYNLLDKGVVNVEIVAPVVSGADSLSVSICSTPQSGSPLCDVKSVSFNVLQNTPSAYCGDGDCDSSIGESFTTCAKDCTAPPVPVPTPTPLDCSKYNLLFGLIPSQAYQSSGKGFLGLFPYETNTCHYDYTMITIIAIVLLVGAVTIYLINKEKRVRR